MNVQDLFDITDPLYSLFDLQSAATISSTKEI